AMPERRSRVRRSPAGWSRRGRPARPMILQPVSAGRLGGFNSSGTASARPAASMWSGIMAPVASSAPNPRYLCLALPYLPTDRYLRQQLGRDWRSARRRDASPFAAVAKIKSALRLVALDETAERAGLSVGQALADARAMI